MSVTYEELEAAPPPSGAPVAAAEVHGSLCGALAAVAGLDTDLWIDELLPEDAPIGTALHARQLLETLVAETRGALEGQEMEFQPLLPLDEEPLGRRVAALTEWCAGYLYGLGSGSFTPGAVPEIVQELMGDVGEISRATIEGEETEESNEGAYAEIVEYLRAGAQLAYEELAAHRATAAQ